MTTAIRVLVIVAAVLMPMQASAKGAKTVSVRGYTTKNGTHVAPYKRSLPSRGGSSSKSSSSSYSGSYSGYSGSTLGDYRSTARTDAPLAGRTEARTTDLRAELAAREAERAAHERRESEADDAWLEIQQKIRNGIDATECLVLLDEFVRRETGTEAAILAANRIKVVRAQEEAFEQKIVLASSWAVSNTSLEKTLQDLHEIHNAIPISKHRKPATELIAAIEEHQESATRELDLLKQKESSIAIAEFRVLVSGFRQRFIRTQAAEEASVLLEKREQREVEATSKLKLAKSLIRIAKDDAVPRRLRDIVNGFPGTEAAAEASELLKKHK